MTVSIQGVKGAFHEEAALNYYGEKVNIQPNVTFSDLIDSIKPGKSNTGIIAVENTISGTIHSNLNLILESGFQITGEVYLHIKQNLVALPGTKISDLKEVHSHYMAINQCRKFFRKYPAIKLIQSDDTALSMKEIAKTRTSAIGAIGSKLGAKEYKLEIIAKSIETNKKNYTRFLVIEKNINHTNEKFNKSSVCLTLPNKKGSLAKILGIMAFYDVDLSKIESLPIIGEPWHYMFYIDLIIDEIENYRSMLQAIRPLTDQLIVMGEYKSGDKSFMKIHKQQ